MVGRVTPNSRAMCSTVWARQPPRHHCENSHQKQAVAVHSLVTRRSGKTGRAPHGL